MPPVLFREKQISPGWGLAWCRLRSNPRVPFRVELLERFPDFVGGNFRVLPHLFCKCGVVLHALVERTSLRDEFLSGE